MSIKNPTRRDFLLQSTAGAAGVALLPLLMCAGNKKKPNILWLISEDTSPDFSCYGTSIVKTPNFDKLAGESVRFTHTFVTGPVCSAARSAFMTGMYQTSIGAHQHRTRDKKVLPKPVKVVTEYFRDAGYFTCNCAGLNREKKGKTDWNFKISGEPFDGTDWSQRKPGQPFFAQINFSMTHRTFKRDKENPIDPDKVKVPPYYPDHPVTRRDWTDYLESIQILDRQVGTVLKRLKDEGLEDDTIVFYFGDHGRPHVRDKQWLYEGGIHVPLIIRWPGHLKPGTVVDDFVSSIDLGPTAMSLAGIKAPEYLQGQVFLGEKAKKREYIIAARDRCDETADRIRCVRAKRYKYIRNFYPDRPYTQFNAYKKRQYPVLTLMEVFHKQGKLTPEQAKFMARTRPEEELYDLQNDPYELNNLADEPGSQKILKEHRTILDKWIKDTGDMGEIKEDKEIIEYWKQHSMERYKTFLKEQGFSMDVSPEDFLKYWENRLLK